MKRGVLALLLALAGVLICAQNESPAAVIPDPLDLERVRVVTLSATTLDAGQLFLTGDAQVKGGLEVWGNVDAGGDFWLAGDAKLHGDLEVWGDIDAGGSFSLMGSAQVRGAAEVWGSLDAGSAIILQTAGRLCQNGRACTARCSFDGATWVCTVAQQVPILRATTLVDSVGEIQNSLMSAPCSGRPGSVCVNDAHGLVVADGGGSSLVMLSPSNTGDAIFLGGVDAGRINAPTIQLRPSTFGVSGTAGLADPNANLIFTQPFSASHYGLLFHEGAGVRPLTPGHEFRALAPSIVTAPNRIVFDISPSLQGFGGWGLRMTALTIASGSCTGGCASDDGGSPGRAGYFAEWHADGGLGPGYAFCSVSIPCDGIPPTYAEANCATDGGFRGPFVPTFGMPSLTYGGSCTNTPTTQVTLRFDIGAEASPQ